jgi:hypothetical protein
MTDDVGKSWHSILAAASFASLYHIAIRLIFYSGRKAKSFRPKTLPKSFDVSAKVIFEIFSDDTFSASGRKTLAEKIGRNV